MKSNVINRERAFQIIIAPQVSEKATFIADKNNQIIFKVATDANKIEIKSAIEQLWSSQKIEVESVQISNVKGKKKRFGKLFGKRSGWKKAYVSLKGKQEIDFTDVKLFEDK